MVERKAISAKLEIKAHAHMLRHACGYKLANDGHDTRALQAYLGHRNIQNTTRYYCAGAGSLQRFLEGLVALIATGKVGINALIRPVGSLGINVADQVIDDFVLICRIRLTDARLLTTPINTGISL